MVETARVLAREVGARIAYTQSDEITLVMHVERDDQQLFCEGRVQKIVSLLAARATAVFNHSLPSFMPDKHASLGIGDLPSFDCRVWTVPNQAEAANVLLWRELDATRNSLSMAARAQWPQEALHGKSSKEMHDLLHEKGINWNDYPAFFKRGTYLRRIVTLRNFEPTELATLPAKHRAHSDPSLQIERAEYAVIEMPPFGRVTNREAVVFEGAEPAVASTP
jgi:tRNA(His) guanylyltransferase